VTNEADVELATDLPNVIGVLAARRTRVVIHVVHGDEESRSRASRSSPRESGPPETARSAGVRASAK